LPEAGNAKGMFPPKATLARRGLMSQGRAGHEQARHDKLADRNRVSVAAAVVAVGEGHIRGVGRSAHALIASRPRLGCAVLLHLQTVTADEAGTRRKFDSTACHLIVDTVRRRYPPPTISRGSSGTRA
jgi:hypothetical protein